MTVRHSVLQVNLGDARDGEARMQPRNELYRRRRNIRDSKGLTETLRKPLFREVEQLLRQDSERGTIQRWGQGQASTGSYCFNKFAWQSPL